jgi:elongation factor P
MAHKYQTSDFRNGLKIELDGNPYQMVYFQFVKPGKGTAFTRTKLKSLLNGNVIERTFRTGETVEAADCEEISMQYQYDEGDMFHFMNMESYEQVGIHKDVMDGAEKYLIDGLELEVMVYKGRPVGVELPNFIIAEITYCEPGVKGNTAQGATKPATFANGATVLVPLFVDQGEIIKVDTRTKEYAGRAKL